MAICDHCGNEYDKAFQITTPGGSGTYSFDSFECAIQMLAPTCARCGCRIIGHGMEAGGSFYCCAHCAEHAGVEGLQDRASGEGAETSGADAAGSAAAVRPASDS